jgi:hypothetical protein
MKSSATFVLVLLGCAGDHAGPDTLEPPAEPPGVWQPMPDADIWDAGVAFDGAKLWWATARRGSSIGYDAGMWLSATSLAGDVLVAPTEIDPENRIANDPAVVVTPTAIVAKLGEARASVRRYDYAGSPLGPPQLIDVRVGDIVNVNDVAVVATASGGVQLVATLQSETTEIEIIDLDDSGALSRHFGSPPDTAGGGTAGAVAAGARPDGSTLIAWDRNYNDCVTDRPSSTLTTTFAGTAIDTIQSVRDLPDSEMSPAIATSGATAYIAWQSESADGARIALARYPDVTNVIAEIANPSYGGRVRLALAGPDRGAIAWSNVHGTELYVAAFADRAGTIHVGAPRVFSTVEPETGAYTVGFVHVGDDRYVLAWIETEGVLDDSSTLYASELDLATEELRPAAPVVPTTSLRPRRWRCP